MPEGTEAAHHGGSGIAKLLQAQTAGLPNWAWLLIIAGGIAAAIIVPNLLGQGAAATPATTDNTGATTPTDNSGLLSAGAGGGGGYDYSSPTTATLPATATSTTTGAISLPSLPTGCTYSQVSNDGVNITYSVQGGTCGYAPGTLIAIPVPAPVAPTPTPTPAPPVSTPPTTAPPGTPLSNLQKIVNYLASLGTGATVSQVGTPGTPQSGYVITGNNVNAGALGALFGGGWSVTKCGTNKYLVKGPGATNVHFGANCVVTGYS